MGKSSTHQKYYLKDGALVPGVTTILGIRDKPALKHWAWKLGTEGKKYWEESRKAANIGTIAHEMIRIHLRGLMEGKSDAAIDAEINDFTQEYSKVEIDKAENAFMAFLDWEKVYRVTPILLEEQMVSEKLRYGGTIDLYGEVAGKRELVDFKTSKDVYPEMKIQVAAYEYLLRENFHPTDGRRILRIGKEDGTFSDNPQPDLHDPYMKWFYGMIKYVYPYDKQIFKK